MMLLDTFVIVLFLFRSQCPCGLQSQRSGSRRASLDFSRTYKISFETEVIKIKNTNIIFKLT